LIGQIIVEAVEPRELLAISKKTWVQQVGVPEVVSQKDQKQLKKVMTQYKLLFEAKKSFMSTMTNWQKLNNKK
jgi:hypothetical protein